MSLLGPGSLNNKFWVREVHIWISVCSNSLSNIFECISAHPNVKAFITHGGSRSLEEAVFYGVPIIGFPTVKSRKVFIQEITMHGAGEIIDPYKLDKDTLKATITAVSTNEK